MTTSSPIATTDPSSSQYDDTFGRASSEFEKLMGQDHKLTDFESPAAVMEVLDKTLQNFDDSEGLRTWLESYVDLLFTISATLWENTQAVSLTHGDSLLPFYCNISFPSASLARDNDL